MATRVNNMEDVRAIIRETIETYDHLMGERFNGVNATLKVIDDKVTYQNGRLAKTVDRVEKLERLEATHVITCPHRDIIQELREEQIKTMAVKKYLRNWVIVATALVNVIVQLVIFILK